MDEALWESACEPDTMLEAVESKASERALRLFGCACCYRIWHLLSDSRSREVVKFVERVAEGLATREEMVAFEEQALEMVWDGHNLDRLDPASLAVELLRDLDAHEIRMFSRDVASFRVGIVGPLWGDGWQCHHVPNEIKIESFWELRGPVTEREEEAAAAERRVHCDILRDIFRNPFRPQPKIAPTVLAWNGGTVSALARAIYDERSFASMPILGDALEDAGCDDADLLAHCRGPNVHVRGCWALDLILGKL